MYSSRDRIIQEALILFNSRGYKAVTISDLASRLGMSKKTIYQHFSSKEQIAFAVIDHVQNHINHVVDLTVIQPSIDSTAQIEQVLRKVKNEIARLSPLFLEDVHKLLPGLWQHIERNRAEKLQFIERLLSQSQKQGFVVEIEPRLAMFIFTEAIQALIKPDSSQRYGYSMDTVFDALIRIFCTGIMKRQ